MCSPALVNVQGGRRGRTGLGFLPQAFSNKIAKYDNLHIIAIIQLIPTKFCGPNTYKKSKMVAGNQTEKLIKCHTSAMLGPSATIFWRPIWFRQTLCIHTATQTHYVSWNLVNCCTAVRKSIFESLARSSELPLYYRPYITSYKWSIVTMTHLAPFLR